MIIIITNPIIKLTIKQMNKYIIKVKPIIIFNRARYNNKSSNNRVQVSTAYYNRQKVIYCSIRILWNRIMHYLSNKSNNKKVNRHYYRRRKVRIMQKMYKSINNSNNNSNSNYNNNSKYNNNNNNNNKSIEVIEATITTTITKSMKVTTIRRQQLDRWTITLTINAIR